MITIISFYLHSNGVLTVIIINQKNVEKEFESTVFFGELLEKRSFFAQSYFTFQLIIL